MAPADFEAFGIDFDGTVYNSKYYAYLIHFINKHWSYLEPLTQKPLHSIDPEPSWAKQVLPELEATELTVGKPEIYITHPGFIKALRDSVRITSDGIDDVSGNPSFFRAFRKYIDLLNCIDPRIMDTIVIKANKNLIDFIAAQQSNSCLVSFSNRQSHESDDYARSVRGTGSMFQDIFVLQKAVAAKLKGKDTFVNGFCTSDIYSDLPRGTTFKSEVTHDGSADDAYAMYDANKVSLAYAIAHDTAIMVGKRYADGGDTTKTNLHLVDDIKDILSSINKIFSNYPELLPKNMVLHLHPYAGNEIGKTTAIIFGTGEIDENYAQNVKILAGLATEDDDDIYVDTAHARIIEEFLRLRVLAARQPRLNSQAGMHTSTEDVHKPAAAVNLQPTNVNSYAGFFTLAGKRVAEGLTTLIEIVKPGNR